MRRRDRAVTLIELLVVLVLLGILSVAIASAFVAGIDLERAQNRRRTEQDNIARMERRITEELQGAFLGENSQDPTTYFIAANDQEETDLGCERITFTTSAPGVPLAVQASLDDFETQQERGGPVGGVAEVSLSATPVGDAGDRQGLFERLQRPADGDATQGGFESVVSPEVSRIGFTFFDGTQWTATWDTVNGAERRLPAAVKVQYTLDGAPEGDVRSFVVPLPASDIDPQNPAAGSNTP